jgi:ATPase subunit of ABC transporter with duplicated ATPase domains
MFFVCTFIIRSVEALSEALSTWGDDDGSILVISHDKAFCEQVGFTHVLTLDGRGGVRLEQREVRASDWDSSGGLSTVQAQVQAQSNGQEQTPAGEVVELDAKQRKLAFNAPKRIAKIEVLVAELEEKIAGIDEKMLSIGNDVGALVDLTKEKESLQAKVKSLMEEWDELEVLLSKVQRAS